MQCDPDTQQNEILIVLNELGTLFRTFGKFREALGAFKELQGTLVLEDLITK